MPSGGKRAGAGRKKGTLKGSVSKRETITVRVHPDLRAALEAAAKRKDKSVSWEIDRRLKESFSSGLREEQIRFFGGEETFALMQLLGQAVRSAGVISTHGLHQWFDHSYSFEVALLAVEKILLRFAPSDTEDGELPEDSIRKHMTVEQIAQSIANGTLHTVEHALPARPVNGARNAGGGSVYYSDQLLMGPEIKRRLGSLFYRLKSKTGRRQ